jgi:Ca2+/Na+ antiporter
MMIAALILGFPWFIMGLGFNTILLLRYLSIKRYIKKDFAPPYNYKVFLKYFISYIILASSLLFIVTLFHEIFFISLVVSTLSNCIYCFIYAIFYFFTKRTPIEKIEEDDSNHISPPQDEKESGKD